MEIHFWWKNRTKFCHEVKLVIWEWEKGKPGQDYRGIWKGNLGGKCMLFQID